MITPEQARMARSRLGLSQKEAASKMSMAHTTLSNIEKGIGDTPLSKLKTVLEFYQNQGLEFFEENGVKDSRTYLKRYRGISGFRQFMDDVYETARHEGGDICLHNSKPDMWIRLLGKDWYDMHRKRMHALGDKIRIRIITHQGEPSVLDFAEHRFFPKDQWNQRVFYAYGPKLGFLDFSHDDVRIMVLSQSPFADEFRELFDIAWTFRAKVSDETLEVEQ